jgi:hypothetical protein
MVKYNTKNQQVNNVNHLNSEGVYRTTKIKDTIVNMRGG